MSNYTDLDSLATSVLAELQRLGYSSEAVAGYRRMYANLARYADENGFTAFSESLAVEFINWKFGTGVEDLYRAKPTTGHMKNYLRSMRIMLEWDSCGCVYKRKPGALGLTSLPEGLQLLLDSYVAECRRNGLSESTIYSRGNQIKNFLLFLAVGGGSDASCITDTSAHDYMMTKASLNPKTVGDYLFSIRRLYRHLRLAGLVDRNLEATVPKPNCRLAPELPGTWTAEDVDALMTAIDRANPTGKRDYAMLLMVARLGLRASDIKAMRISDLNWEERRISIVQHKTGVPLELPLLDDVGWAVIDYLRNGRPAGANCPELFVRHLAPFDPFGPTSNLTNVLVSRARKAGVKAKGDRKTLHSLRHALARRLLDSGTSVEDISRILGHSSKRSTSTYLRMDLESLADCPLDPEGVM